MGKILQLQLKQKVIALTNNDYTSEPLKGEETSELYAIATDLECDLDERILAAKVMLNVAEARKKRAVDSVNHFNGLHGKLVHEREFGKHIDSTAKQVESALGVSDDVIAMLEAMLERKLDSK